jgi:preprotein translocase subunit SecD
VPHTSQKVINEATINERLGNNFIITGIGNARAAQNLSMMIRAGALPAPIQIAESKQIGPTLGRHNIEMGEISVTIAMVAIMIFMALYYRLFGLIADFALFLNLILIVAVMSIMPGATLTLPGIAGIVLNVGMAIDANVLIFERIREEIRNGTSMQAAIHAGYARAFGTIVDSNVTTLIVALILFAVGTGAIKGFAVTLMIGIVSSMFTAITVTRGLVNVIYGKRQVKQLSIGIKAK